MGPKVTEFPQGVGDGGEHGEVAREERVDPERTRRAQAQFAGCRGISRGRAKVIGSPGTPVSTTNVSRRDTALGKFGVSGRDAVRPA